MCQWTKYGSFRIDPCLQEFITELQQLGLKTMLSCCGHGKYEPTIIYESKAGDIREFFSQIIIAQIPRKSKRYYKRDHQGHFYIPEVEAKRKEIKE